MPAGNHMASRWKNDSNSMRSPSSNAIIIFVERSDLQKTVSDPQVLQQLTAKAAKENALNPLVDEVPK